MKHKLPSIKLSKKLWVTLVALGTAVALLGGIVVISRTSADPVNVYPFEYIGMTEYWGDNQESYGPVSSDNVQSVFLSETQTVTKVFVKEGDNVKKGDLLFTLESPDIMEQRAEEIRAGKLVADRLKEKLEKLGC